MVPYKDLKKVRLLLKKAENPIFFFDDDPDGLASFLLLKKYINKGKGIVIKSSPPLSAIYLKKIQEYSPDMVFVLDKPNIEQEFINKANKPIIWIDHHPPTKREGVHLYINPRLKNPSINLATSYLCYKITKQNMWIAAVGIVGDWQIPKFFNAFLKKYPGLAKKTTDPGYLLYNTKIGELVKFFSFILKGKISEVKKSISILSKIESPYEILNKETPKAKYLYKKFEKTNKEYNNLLKRIKPRGREKLLVFTYPSTKTSFTGNLANEFLYKYPKKVILIAREKSGEMRFSLRSKRIIISKILKKALEDIDGYGGGHEYACGGSVKKYDFIKFVNNLKKLI